MESVTAPYDAVYHFRDEHLLETFIAEIPRSQLLEYVRSNELLRNRYFPGFRISNTVPTCQQVLTAYKKEIIDHHNDKLASSLCAHWIRQQPFLASAALKSLSIQSEDPADANLWIKDVQTKLELEPHEGSLRRLVRALAVQFSSEDVHIFVSIISYGADQQTLRKLVEQELLNVANDPQILKERIESDLEAAKTKIKNLERLGSELECQLQSELTEAREALDVVLREDDELATRLAQDESLTQGLTDELEQIKARLLERQHARDATKNQKQKLSKAIKRQREALSRTQTSFDQRLKEARASLDQQSSHVAELVTELKQINGRVLVEKSTEIPGTPPAIQSHPSTEIHTPGPAPMSSPSAPEPLKRPLDILGNNAVCYQGIQRTFRNAVVTLMGEEREIDLPGFAAGQDVERFREKTHLFLRAHENDPVIHKLRWNELLKKQDLDALEQMLVEAGAGTKDDISRVTAGRGLGLFVRSMVGLDREAAKRAFHWFLAGKTLTANQIQFVNLVVDYVTQSGWMSPAQLYESPFTDFSPRGIEGVFDPAQVTQLLSVLESIRQTADV
jgi:hypothetical protein